MQQAILDMDFILRVNANTGSYERRKLVSWLETDCSSALAAARTTYSAFRFASGDLGGARLTVATTRPKVADLVRNAHSDINAIPNDDVPPADKLDALISLGFEQGELGNLLDPVHLKSLAQQIVDENGNLPVAVRVRASIVNRLTNWLGILNAAELLAGEGSRETITEAKDTARDFLMAVRGQVRLYVASTHPDGERAKVLALYNFQPQRDPGEAQSLPLPAAPGTAAFNGGTRLLTIPDLPEHATSIVAWRQVAGAEPEQCGISDTNEVSVADVSPLVPGVTYTLWVTGHNSRGDGPASNKITFTA